jgi:transposase
VPECQCRSSFPHFRDLVTNQVMYRSGSPFSVGRAVLVAVALTFRSAVDDPTRFRSLKRIGPWVGLTPSRNQSGERDVSGGITKAGDVNLRRALCQAATVMMNRGRSTWLRTSGVQLAHRRK